MICDLTAHALDHFYNSLLDKPAVVLKGHKSTDKTISPHVIGKIHALMKSALDQAVTWGYIQTNPATNVALSKPKSRTRKVWTPERAQTAIDRCPGPVLRPATEVYSHMQDEDRRVLARKVENKFFQKNSQTVPETPQDSDVAQAHALLESNPELAKLLLALKATA